VLIDGIYIEIYLREAYKRILPISKYESSTLTPTGEFIFKIGSYSGDKEWRDGKVKIEENLAKILAKLEIEAEKKMIREEESRIRHIQYEAEKKIKEEIKQRRDQEVIKFNKLVALSEQYDKTLKIRQYIEATKQHTIDNNTLTPAKKEWIDWANDKADWLDPLINKADDILDP
jgi:hypothetical protein